MAVIDDFTRERLAIHVARRIRSKDAIDVFANLILVHGVSEHIRSDNGPEMMLRNCTGGSRASAQRRCTSRRTIPRRVATASRSMAGYVTRC